MVKKTMKIRQEELLLLVLNPLFNDEALYPVSLGIFNDPKTSTSKITYLFMRLQRVGFLDFIDDTVKMSFFTGFFMSNGSDYLINRFVANGTYFPRDVSFS
ncbi:MAG: hypothetical protein AMS17_10190 [Spirochaetes bacterium DG_61]|nr:MAG: hypothetical protein AMS17_10190 [Spirochaetes bacterium DG_61]